MQIQIRDIVPGNWIDLEGDQFADPDCDHPAYEFEWQIVETVEKETPNCIAVYLQDGKCIGFPPEHWVTVHPEKPDSGH